MIISPILLVVACTLQDFVVNGDSNKPEDHTDAILKTTTTPPNKTSIKCIPQQPSFLRRTSDNILNRKPPITKPELLLCKPKKPQSFFSKITSVLFGRRKNLELNNMLQKAEELPLCEPGEAPARRSFLTKLFGNMLGRKKSSCKQPSSLVATATTIATEITQPKCLLVETQRKTLPLTIVRSTTLVPPGQPEEHNLLKVNSDLQQRGLFAIFKKTFKKFKHDISATTSTTRKPKPKPPCTEGLIKKFLKGIAFQVPSFIDFLLLRKVSKFANEEC